MFRVDDRLRLRLRLHRAEIVADALSRKSSHTLAILIWVKELNREFAKGLAIIVADLEILLMLGGHSGRRVATLPRCFGYTTLIFEENLSSHDADP